jgi:phosphoglycolate phosphatase-like HAD superfamily hydrolase
MTSPLLLFDIDGTLVHVAEEVAFARAFLEHCGRDVDLSYAADMVITDTGYARGVLRRAGLAHGDDDIDLALARFVTHLCSAIETAELPVRAVAGAAAFVDAMHGILPLAVATGCVEGSARAKLAAVGLDARLPCGGYSRREQSRAEILERAVVAAAAHYGRDFTPRTTIYFGDGPWDVAAARTAGVHFVGINEHDGSRTRLRDAGAELIFPDYSDRSAIEAAIRARIG